MLSQDLQTVFVRYLHKKAYVKPRNLLELRCNILDRKALSLWGWCDRINK